MVLEGIEELHDIGVANRFEDGTLRMGLLNTALLDDNRCLLKLLLGIETSTRLVTDQKHSAISKPWH